MAITNAGLVKIAGYLKQALEPDTGDFITMVFENTAGDVKSIYATVGWNAVVAGPPVKLTMNLSTNERSIHQFATGAELKRVVIYRDDDSLAPFDTALITMTRTSALTFTDGGRLKINTFEISLTEV